MIDWPTWILLAYEAAEEVADGKDAAPQGGPFGLWFWPIMITLLLFMILNPFRPREDKKLKKLIDSLKRNDRVVTVGGIYGIVANIKPDADEVVLKIDEDKDVKITVTKSAILRKDSPSEDDKPAQAGK